MVGCHVNAEITTSILEIINAAQSSHKPCKDLTEQHGKVIIDGFLENMSKTSEMLKTTQAIIICNRYRSGVKVYDTRCGTSEMLSNHTSHIPTSRTMCHAFLGKTDLSTEMVRIASSTSKAYTEVARSQDNEHLDLKQPRVTTIVASRRPAHQAHASRRPRSKTPGGPRSSSRYERFGRSIRGQRATTASRPCPHAPQMEAYRQRLR